MSVQRMDNVGIVVEDLSAAQDFFLELGLELQGKTVLEENWANQVVGLKDMKVEITMMMTPDGHSKIELMKFLRPSSTGIETRDTPMNTLGIRRIMFAVDDIEDVIERLQRLGAELVGEIVNYEDTYLLCYLRGPEGIIIALVQDLS